MKPSAKATSATEICSSHGEPARGRPWPEEDITDAIRMFTDGASYTEISLALGRRYTRNAVCGMLNRRGIQRRYLVEQRPISHERRRQRAGREQAILQRIAKARATPAQVVSLPRTARPIAGAETILTVAEGQCRYIGGPADFLPTRDTPVCGAPCDEGHAYCAEHHAVVFQ